MELISAPTASASDSAPHAPGSAPAGGPRPAAVAFIFITIVLDVLALGIIIPVLPKLVSGFLGNDTARTAKILGLFSTVWALMQFVSSPIMGALSDRFGRRRVILVSNFGLGFDYLLMALAPTLSWLFVGRVISGITAASFTTASAYVADVTPPEKRAAGFGMLGAAFGLGFILGPAVGGLLGGMNPRLPFWVAGALALANAMYGLFVLPESLPKSSRRPFTWARANPIGALSLLRSHPVVLGLSGVNMVGYLAHNVIPSMFVLYVGYRFGWSERMVGLTLAISGLCSMLMQGVLIRPIVARLGERRAQLLGLVAGTVSFAIYGLAPTGAIALMGVPLFALMGIYGPASQSLITRHISASEQGQLQGANSSLMAITGLFGPSLFTLTFAYFIGPRAPLYLPGAPFLLAALIMLVGLPLAVLATRPRAA